jgi:parallel beta-helix repeat protein
MITIQNLTIKLFIITTLAFTAFFFTSNAFAATIIVDSNTGGITADGECNLAEAIANANDDAATHADCAAGEVGTDTIAFNIGATNDTEIITDADADYNISSPIIIDGLTQGDASCGTVADLSDRDLDIEVDGIAFALAAGSDGSRIQGISMMSDDITSSNVRSIPEDFVDGFTLRCSNVGIDGAGTSSTALVRDQLNFENISNLTIGGPDLADTNIFANANLDGSSTPIIFQGNNDGITIQNNWIGRGIGPTFPEFPGNGAIDFCGPSICNEDPGDLSTNVTIDSNIMITDNGGIDLSGITTLVFTNNIISNAEFNAVQIAVSDDVLIDANTFSDNGYAAIFTQELSDVEITNNYIYDNGGMGILLTGSDNTTIQGNYIGVDETGLVAASNSTNPLFGQEAGIVLGAVNNITIGGSGDGEGNIIAGNDADSNLGAIWILPDFFSDVPTFAASSNITIQGNYIGVGADGVTPLPNTGFGIFALAGDEILIGGTEEGEGNIIQGATDDFPGILFVALGAGAPAEIKAQNLTVIGNSIYNNAGKAFDLAVDTEFEFFPNALIGPNPNDAGDTDEGPGYVDYITNNLNHLLNYPEFTSTETPEGSLTTDIEYTLDVPAGDYRIEFFQNSTESPTGYGEGETFLGFQNITHTGSGEETFTTTLDVTVGDYIAATTTERGQATFSTFGATSEFSAAATIAAMVEEVTRRRSSSTKQSKAKAQEAFAEYYAEENADNNEESPSNNNSPENILDSGTCPAELMVTDNMKQGDRDGQYSAYNNGNVTQVALLQQHINRILAAQYNQAAGPIDGIFGPLTKQGVERLQTALNEVLQPNPLLIIDGVVGPFTKSAINGSCGDMEEVTS